MKGGPRGEKFPARADVLAALRALAGRDVGCLDIACHCGGGAEMSVTVHSRLRQLQKDGEPIERYTAGGGCCWRLMNEEPPQ